MEFLEDNQICAWAEAHSLSCSEGFVVTLPDLPSAFRGEYARGRQSGHEKTTAADFITRLGAWDECLVAITSWGVWPSGEDWPQFYAWRGTHGERRSLEVAPGHGLVSTEIAVLTELLTFIMENAWDADVFCSRRGRADVVRGRISHDEWYEILGMPDAVG